MGLIPGYENDIFISYAHNGNLSVFGFKWVDWFHENLEHLLIGKLGERPVIWRDPRMDQTDLIKGLLDSRVNTSALMLVIVSPSYLKSKGCGRERETFVENAARRGGLRVANKSRIIKVVKTYDERTVLPEELQETLGGEFLRHEQAAGKYVELDPQSNEYRQKLEALADVTVQVVKTYRLRLRLHMAYPVAMETPPAFPHEVWERTPPEAQAYIQMLEARVETLASLVRVFQEQVRTLQEQLHQTSQNASRPPSSDPPQHGRPRRSRSKRRRSGQPGHPGQTRTLIPVEEVDEVVVIKPDQCPHCQGPLSGDDPKPWRHQVIEMPPLQPVVTEYQWHQLRCSVCGEVTWAAWPAGVPSGTYGPRVQATVALCTGAYRLSKRTTQQAMVEVWGIPMSVGTISQLEQAATAAVAAPVEEARIYVHEQAVAHLDETSWRQGGKRAWLWVAVTSWVTVCVVRMSRGGQVARELLGVGVRALRLPGERVHYGV